MSTQQVAKIRLAPFNTAEYGEYMDGMTFPRTYYSGAVDNAAGYAAGVSTLVADGNFVGEDPTGYIIYFAGHNAHYRIESTSIAGVLKLNLNLDKPLEKAVVDNEVITICRWYDITDCAIDVSDLEQEIEVNQNELVLDKQIRFRLFNFDETFYDRTTFTSAWDNVSAYFTTRNTQNASDNKYVGIWVYNQTAAAYQQIYAGQIVRDEVQINEPQAEIRFMAESVFYGLNDITVSEVQNIFNGHKYTSSTRPTKTVSGRYMDIIVNMFHTAGIPKKTLDVTSKEKNAGQCKIGFVSDPKIIYGEYIEIPDSMGSDYAGKHICDGVETIAGIYYVYYTFGTNTVAIDNSDISGGCIAHRVYFDITSDFYNVTIGDQHYKLDDCFMITEKWDSDSVSFETARNLLDDIHKLFLAYSSIRFKNGYPYGFFRSKLNSSPVLATLSQDDFIKQAEIAGNWRFKNLNSVELRTTVNLYNGESIDFNFAAQPNLFPNGYNYTFASEYNNTLASIKSKKIVSTALKPSSDYFTVGDKIKFSDHDEVYTITEVDLDIFPAADPYVDGMGVNPPLKKSLHVGTRIYFKTNDSVTINFASSFRVKTKYPILYWCSNANDKIFSGKNIGTSLVDYDLYELLNVSGVNIGAGNPSGICISNPSPFNYNNNNPFGFSLITARGDVSGSSMLINWPSLPYEAIPSTGVSLNPYGSNASVLDSSATNDKWLFLTNGYAFQQNIRTLDTDTHFILCASETSGNNFYYYKLAYENQGDCNEDTTATIQNFGYSLFTVPDSYNDASQKYGMCQNSSVLNPDFDDLLYVSYPFGNKIIRVSPFDEFPLTTEEVLYNVFSSNGDLSINHGYDSTMQRLYVFSNADDQLYVNDAADFSSFTSILGAGASTPSLGSSISGSNMSFSDPIGVHKCYDNLIALTDRGNEKVYIYDADNDLVYCIADNATQLDPMQITGIDFVCDPQMLLEEIPYDSFYENIITRSAELYNEYYSKDRRIVRGSLRWDDIDYLDIGVGDRMALDTTVVANNTYAQTIFWISKLSFNFETQEYDVEFLEDTDADQGIGSMIIGQDFVIS